MTDVNDEEIQLEKPISVGERLQQARKTKKLTIADVAAQLRLTQDNIHCLEVGQWEKLYGRAYARGYFSSYVKLLGLDEDEFLAAFDQDYKSLASDTVLTNLAANVESQPFPWLRLLTIIVLLTIIWFAYQQWQASAITSDIEDNSELEQSTLQQNSEFSESVVEAISQPVEAIVTEKDVVASEGDVPAESEATTPMFDVVTENITETDVLIVENSPELATIVAPIEDLIEETFLALEFSQDCWVKVSDANAQVLINKLMKADTSLELTGKTPLMVSLGRASAVNIKVDDKDFDLRPFTDGDVAKFSLGNEA